MDRIRTRRAAVTALDLDRQRSRLLGALVAGAAVLATVVVLASVDDDGSNPAPPPGVTSGNPGHARPTPTFHPWPGANTLS